MKRCIRAILPIAAQGIVYAMLICAMGEAFAQSRKQDSLIATVKQMFPDSLCAITLCEIAEEYRTILPDSALFYAKQAEELSMRLGFVQGLIRSLNIQANVIRDRGAYADAIIIYKRALYICDSAGRLIDKPKLFNNLAIAHSRQGNYVQALENHFQSLRIKEKLGDSLGMANSMANIGLIYKKQGQYDEALKMYDLALRTFKTLNSDVGMAAVLNNIGAIYRIREKYDSAQVYYEASLEVERRIGKQAGNDNPPNVATALINLADIYVEKKEYVKARKTAEEAFKLYSAIGDRSGLITATRMLGVVCAKEGKINEALSYLNRSIEIAQSLHEPEEMRDSYLSLSELYEKSGDYSKALEAYKNFHALYDTLLNLEKAKTINSLKTQFETEKKEKEIERLRQEKEIQELELSRQTLLRNSFIIISVLALALATTAYRSYRIKQRSEQVLREKNHALDVALKVAEQQRQVAEAQRKVAEEQRKVAEEQRQIAEEANRIKTELLSIAAHDLKNPLQSISGFAELAQEQLEKAVANNDASRGATVRVFLERIYSSSQRMAELIKCLLETAVLEEGRIALNLTETNISALAEAVVAEYEVRAKQKNQVIQTQIEPNCCAKADQVRLREVIENLLSNAIKYSPNGKKITLCCEKKKEPARAELAERPVSVLIAVKDEGQGLTEADKKKVFGKFQRLSARPTGGESSTGLGLAIVKQIVELHGGKVWVESEGKDKGATFYVTLPANSTT
jgi:signal transduction histidine kinase